MAWSCLLDIFALWDFLIALLTSVRYIGFACFWLPVLSLSHRIGPQIGPAGYQFWPMFNLYHERQWCCLSPLKLIVLVNAPQHQIPFTVSVALTGQLKCEWIYNLHCNIKIFISSFWNSTLFISGMKRRNYLFHQFPIQNYLFPKSYSSGETCQLHAGNHLHIGHLLKSEPLLICVHCHCVRSKMINPHIYRTRIFWEIN